MYSEKLQKFADKELSKYGMDKISGGEEPIIILAPPPKKVFPSSSSATHIFWDPVLGEFVEVVDL